MIRFLSGEQLNDYDELRHSMHLDRAVQFSQRLKWDVNVDSDGQERDEYDQLSTLYIVVENNSGLHMGSMRLLPTIGRTMVNDHFLHLMNGVKIVSPHIWECTRFCISPTADRLTAARLLAAGAYFMKVCCIDHFVGVFDQRMERIYRAIGASPTILGWQNDSQGQIGVGAWEFDKNQFKELLLKGRLSEDELDWFYGLSSIQEEPAVSDFDAFQLRDAEIRTN